jgi:hypothetical protein
MNARPPLHLTPPTHTRSPVLTPPHLLPSTKCRRPSGVAVPAWNLLMQAAGMQLVAWLPCTRCDGGGAHSRVPAVSSHPAPPEPWKVAGTADTPLSSIYLCFTTYICASRPTGPKSSAGQVTSPPAPCVHASAASVQRTAVSSSIARSVAVTHVVTELCPTILVPCQ